MSELVPYSSAPTPPEFSLSEVEKLAEHFVKSNMFKGILPSQAVVKVLAGRELGIPPFAAMTGINMIQGKPELSAHLLSSLIRKSGVYDYEIDELTPKRCQISFFRHGKKLKTPSIFTIEDAKQAGLLRNEVWTKYPEAMLYARALSKGARLHCPDVTVGVIYTTGEISGEEEPPELPSSSSSFDRKKITQGEEEELPAEGDTTPEAEYEYSLLDQVLDLMDDFQDAGKPYDPSEYLKKCRKKKVEDLNETQLKALLDMLMVRQELT